jgi:hypothetical protein
MADDPTAFEQRAGDRTASDQRSSRPFNACPPIGRARCDNRPMIKWLIATVLALALFSGLMPFLRRFGIGRLPGDFTFTVFGREISLPIMSTVLLSMLAAGIAHLL